VADAESSSVESSLGVKLGKFGVPEPGRQLLAGLQAGRLAGWERMLQQAAAHQRTTDRPDSVSVAAKPAGTFAANRWPARFGSDAKAGESRRFVARPNKKTCPLEEVKRMMHRQCRPQENHRAPRMPAGTAGRQAGRQAGWLAGVHSQSWLLANGRARCVEMEGRGMP
jgi:hypothetical protein